MGGYVVEVDGVVLLEPEVVIAAAPLAPALERHDEVPWLDKVPRGEVKEEQRVQRQGD